MFGWIFDSLYQAISYPFFTLGWYIFVYIPLSIIGFFNFVFQQLGIQIIVRAIFGHDQFSFEKLPTGFWVFLIASVAIGFIFMVIRFVKFLTLRHQNSSIEISQMTKGLVVSLSFSFLFPILIFVLFAVLQAFMLLLNQYIQGGQGLVYLLVKSSTNKIGESQISQIAQDYHVLSIDEFNKFNNGEGILMIITLSVGAILISYTLGISFISWFISSAQLFMNFITMPAWATNSILDDGRSLKKWVRSFTGQIAVIIIYQMSFNIFLMWVSATFVTVESLNLLGAGNNSFIYKFFIKLAFIAGGGLAISTFTQQVAAHFKQGGMISNQQRLASSTLKVGGAALGAVSYGLSKINSQRLKPNSKGTSNLSSIQNIKSPINRFGRPLDASENESKNQNWFDSLKNGLFSFGAALGSLVVGKMRKKDKAMYPSVIRQQSKKETPQKEKKSWWTKIGSKWSNMFSNVSSKPIKNTQTSYKSKDISLPVVIPESKNNLDASQPTKPISQEQLMTNNLQESNSESLEQPSKPIIENSITQTEIKSENQDFIDSKNKLDNSNPKTIKKDSKFDEEKFESTEDKNKIDSKKDTSFNEETIGVQKESKPTKPRTTKKSSKSEEEKLDLTEEKPKKTKKSEEKLEKSTIKKPRTTKKSTTSNEEPTESNESKTVKPKKTKKATKIEDEKSEKPIEIKPKRTKSSKELITTEEPKIENV